MGQGLRRRSVRNLMRSDNPLDSASLLAYFLHISQGCTACLARFRKRQHRTRLNVFYLMVTL